MTTTTQKQLTGEELLTFKNNNQDATKQELVKGSGYYTIKEDGSIRYNYTEFYTALLEAKGVVTEPKKERVVTDEDVTYTIEFPVQTMVTVTVEGKDGLTREEIVELVTREDLSNSEGGDISWSDIKNVFNDTELEDFYIQLQDEEGDVVEID